jgi:hypothetical protein
MILETSSIGIILSDYRRGQEVGVYFGRYGVTRYSSRKRNVRHNLVTYSDLACRKTGEVHCCHIEWRAKGASALKTICIHSPSDLLRFDHPAFWEKNLLLRDIDLRALGRQWLNRGEGISRNKPRLKPYGKGKVFDRDLQTGSMLFRLAGMYRERRSSVQELVDDYRAILPDITRCLRPIPLDILKPENLEPESTCSLL